MANRRTKKMHAKKAIKFLKMAARHAKKAGK
jgi:hypothetical protein